MNIIKKTIFSCIIFCLGGSFLCSQSFAQEVSFFRLTDIGGSLRFRYQHEGKTQPLISNRPYFKETLGLQSLGYIISPKVLDFRWNGNLTLSQERYTSSALKQYTAGRYINNYISALFFKETAFPSVIVWNRLNNVLEIDYGGRTTYDVNKLRTAIQFQKLFLPSTLRAEISELKEEWSRAGWTTKRDQLRRNIQYTGRQEGNRTKLDLNYERMDTKDRLYSDRSYITHTARMRFFYYFDKDKNNNWDTNLRFYKRSGNRDYQNVKAIQLLKLKHSYGFSSSYRYNFSGINTWNYNSRFHTGFVTVEHQLFNSLTTNINGGGNTGSMSDGKETGYSYNGGINYNKSIPFSGNFQISYNFAHSLTDRQIEGKIITVMGEQHIFINDLPVFLNERNIIASTVAVFNRKGDILYEQGDDKDYVIEIIGDMIALYRNPLGRIPEGQTISVDYQLNTSPSMKYETNTTSINTGLFFNWLSLYYKVNRHEQDLLRGIPGNESFLQNLFKETAGIKIFWRGNASGISILAERKKQESRIFDYEQMDVRSSFYLTPTRTTVISSKFTLSSIDHTKIDRTLIVYGCRAELQWRPTNIFSITGFGKLRLQEETQKDDQYNLDFGGNAQWYWRAMRLKVSYQNQYWEYGVRQIKTNRFIVEFERSF